MFKLHTGCGKTRVLVDALIAMTTVAGRSFKMLITTQNDAGLKSVSDALKLARQHLINKNAANLEHFKFILFEHFASQRSFTRLRAIEPEHGENALPPILTYQQRLSAANILVCPHDKIINLKK